MRISIVLSLLLACHAKPMGSDTETATGSTTEDPVTGGLDESWSFGYWIRPGTGNASPTLATIEIKPDYKAELVAETCGSDQKYTKTVGWKSISEQSIEFISLDGMSSPFFGQPAYPVIMSKTDLEGRVRVTDGKSLDNAQMGDYVYSDAPVCLVLKDPILGCDLGAFVSTECPVN